VKDDRTYLIHISECIANIHELATAGREAFMAAKHDQAAILYYLQTMAESTQRLSAERKTTHPEIEWTAISGFRNRLVHDYLGINLNVVWNVIENYLPSLKQAVEAMLHELDTPDQ
jgi:uncharacterized protein with HEPN domain